MRRLIAASLLALAASIAVFGGLPAFDALAGGAITDPESLLWWLERAGEEARLALLCTAPAERVKFRVQLAEERLFELFKQVEDPDSAAAIARAYRDELSALVEEMSRINDANLLALVRKALERQRSEILLAQVLAPPLFKDRLGGALRSVATALEALPPLPPGFEYPGTALERSRLASLAPVLAVAALGAASLLLLVVRKRARRYPSAPNAESSCANLFCSALSAI